MLEGEFAYRIWSLKMGNEHRELCQSAGDGFHYSFMHPLNRLCSCTSLFVSTLKDHHISTVAYTTGCATQEIVLERESRLQLTLKHHQA